jgi:ribosomal protein L29
MKLNATRREIARLLTLQDEREREAAAGGEA